MIKTVEIRNFKSIRSAKIELERLTVFVGANGSGKTSVLQAVELISRVASKGLSGVDQYGQLRWGEAEGVLSATGSSREFNLRGANHPQWLRSHGASDCIEIAAASGLGIVSLKIEQAVTNDSWQPDPYEKQIILDEPICKCLLSIHKKDGVERSSQLIPPSISLRLDFNTLAQPSVSELEIPEFSPTGAGLAEVLHYMHGNQPEAFSEIVNQMRGFVPKFERLRFERIRVARSNEGWKRIWGKGVLGGETQFASGLIFDFIESKGVPAHVVSEGTLLLLGILTAIESQSRARVLLIDDIDRALHPLAQRQLIETLRKLMDRFPDLQILATSHSPYLIDCLKPEEVRLMALNAKGESVCGLLTDHPKFERWKKEMAPGELWSMFGEKWVAEEVGAK